MLADPTFVSKADGDTITIKNVTADLTALLQRSGVKFQVDDREWVVIPVADDVDKAKKFELLRTANIPVARGELSPAEVFEWLREKGYSATSFMKFFAEIPATGLPN
jgi:hypothetical protein